MRILQIAPMWERVPPPAYGGIEYIVSVLTEELVRRGHTVTLAASGDSRSTARLKSVHPRSLRSDESVVLTSPYNWLHVGNALAEADAYDIIHNHAGELAVAASRLVATPMLTTLHNLIEPEARPIWETYQGYYNTPSRAAARGLRYPNFVGVIYHGIDVKTFPFREKKEDYLLFLSRMSPEKGPLEAIEVARRLDRILILAGKVDARDRDFFESEVKPLIDGRLVQYVGEADYQLKRELYAGACCVLFPIKWDELFGLVLTEAMACGTPVVSFRRGAAPEVVADGFSGFLVDDVEGMVEAIKRIDQIKPRNARTHVERYFSVDSMVDAYLAAYERIIERERWRTLKHRQVSPPSLGLAG